MCRIESPKSPVFTGCVTIPLSWGRGVRGEGELPVRRLVESFNAMFKVQRVQSSKFSVRCFPSRAFCKPQTRTDTCNLHFMKPSETHGHLSHSKMKANVTY